MINPAAPAIVTAKDGADDLAINFRHAAQPRIALEIICHFLTRIAFANLHAFHAAPQRDRGVVVGYHEFSRRDAAAHDGCPANPKRSASACKATITPLITSSTGMPSSAAPRVMSSRFTARANALSFIFFFTEATSPS